MATPAQIAANRRNAEKSSGPKTEEGKANSCRNRLSHGFTSAAKVIPGEDREEYKALLFDLMDEYQPATPTEQIYVERMVQNQWLALRAVRFQAIYLKATLDEGQSIKELGLLIRYHQTSERGFCRAHSELVKAQKERKKSEIGFVSQKPAQPAETPVQTAPQPTPEPASEQKMTPEIDPGIAELEAMARESDQEWLEILANIEARKKAA